MIFPTKVGEKNLGGGGGARGPPATPLATALILQTSWDMAKNSAGFIFP